MKPTEGINSSTLKIMNQVEIQGLKTPVVLENHGPVISEVCISRFENRISHRLPSDYREFLLKYNGGDPVVGIVKGRDDREDIPYQHGESIRSFLMLAPLEGEVPEFQELKAPTELDWSLPANILPIADDAFGNSFAIDLESTDGLVRFIDHESLDDDITQHRVLADSFLDLLLRVVSVEENEARERAEKLLDRRRIEVGEFPSRLVARIRIVAKQHSEVAAWCRSLSLKLFDAKGHFSVHDDSLSRLLLDLMFWINEIARNTEKPTPRTELATIIYDWWSEDEVSFGLKGYAPGFIDEWWKDRLSSGALVGDYTAARFSSEASADFLKKLQAEISR